MPSWWSSFWPFAPRPEETARSLREALAHDPVEAWRAGRRALVARQAPPVLHAVAEIARVRGAVDAALHLDRAADDPSDPARLLDAATALARHDALDAAIAMLEHALGFAPFDAVLRSELAILYARDARPAESAAALALHPCLADDPGALFQFAWSSLLAGDHDSARGCLPALREHRSARTLADVLQGALSRAAIVPAPADLRDWTFVEHGAVLLDQAGPDRGAYGELVLDEAAVRRLASRAVGALRVLHDVPIRRVVPASDRSASLARMLADALGTVCEAPPRGGVPAGFLVAIEASELEPLWSHVPEGAEVRTLALALREQSDAHVPDVLGAVVSGTGAPGSPSDSSPFEEALRERAEALRTTRIQRPFSRDAPLWRTHF